MSAVAAVRLLAGLSCAAAALLAGCAHTTGKKMAAQGRADLSTATVCGPTLSSMLVQPLPPKPTSFVIDKNSQAFAFDDGKAYFAGFELPAYEGKSYSIVFTSLSQGLMNDEAIFLPKILLLDADYRITRRYDERDLRSRGSSRLERTIFINPANAGERYVVVYGAPIDATFERTVQQITSQPIFAGPVVFNWQNGVDVKKTLTSSPVGEFEVEVQGRKAQP